MGSRRMRIAIAAFGVGLGLLGEAVSFEGSITPESALLHFLVGLASLLGRRSAVYQHSDAVRGPLG